MKRITVYADFDFLASPQEIGILGYERVRGKDHFVFEYSHEWLKQHGGIVLSGDLMNVPSLQHPRGTDNVFGFVKDSFPDRWGRLLLDRRERLTAQTEGRAVRVLTNYDYLNTLLAACNNYMLEHQEAAEIIDEVRDAVKDWRKIATELQIPHKMFAPYCNRWDL